MNSRVIRKTLWDYWNSFSFIGLVVATLFFALSVTPSLLPRPYFVQGILSGFAIAVGYSLGVGGVLLYQFLELKNPSEEVQRRSKWVTSIAVAIVFVVFSRQMTFWQNSIRELMEMPPVETAYPYRMGIIAIVSGAILILLSRGVIYLARLFSNWLRRVVPRRIAIVLGSGLVGLLLLIVANDLVAHRLLDAADAFFLNADMLVDDGVEQPTEEFITGSSNSLVDWETIGRRGKDFIVLGPTRDEIASFLGRDAKQPIRVYVGMRTSESPRERAELALEELKRVGAFERSLLVVSTPTGTGWIDPGAVDTLEYIHAGDTAIVSTQYSYLPSWMTIVVDPERSIESADALFDVVYEYWKTLPKESRPKLYLQGLSLGSLGGEVSAELYTIFEDPIHGAVWSGPPFPSRRWNDIVAHRNIDSTLWMPTFRDGRLVRFTSQRNHLDPAKSWGPIRTVYIQYASDPMVFFSPSLLYRKPDWLVGERGPDVSPFLNWYPIVTFLQIAFDLPMATSIPIGYGHNYAPQHYLDAWIEVSQPADWRPEMTARLKNLFRSRPAQLP